MKRKDAIVRIWKSKRPLTYRYCRKCRQMRHFEYNPTIFHSECVMCGCRLAYHHIPNQRYIYFIWFSKICNEYEISMNDKTFKET